MKALPEAPGTSDAERLLVIVPTYNEALNVDALIGRILAAGDELDVLVVDDNSPDGTGQRVEELALRHPGRVSLLRRGAKSGRGGAVLAGLAEGWARGYSGFVEMDADLSHQPEELPVLRRAAVAADVVVGSRYVPGGAIHGWRRRRHIWSRMSNGLIGAVLRLPIRDYTNGYRLYGRRAAEVLLRAPLRERGYIALSESAYVLHRAGLRFSEVPTRFVNRQFGESNMGAAEAVGALRALLRIKSRHRAPRS